MGTLKFRVWSEDQKTYKYKFPYNKLGKFYVSENGIVFSDFGNVVVPEVKQEAFVVEQYTGLKDNDGKKIYEGDIISFSIPHFNKSTLGYDGETDLVGKIVFDYDRFDIEDKDGVHYDLYFAEEGEVIGNIHENLELLGINKVAEQIGTTPSVEFPERTKND